MKVGELYAELRLVTDAFDQGIASAGGALKSFGQSMMNTGRDVMTLTAPLAAVGGGAIKTGMEFDSSFAKIQGLVGISGTALEGLKTKVLALAGQTAKSPNELADALYYLTSSGLSAAASADVLEVAAKASAAGLGDTADVAKAVAFALNAYKDQGLTAAHATDVLVAAVRDGTIEADEMAPVLGRLLPITSALGISYDQVAASLAVMSRTGLDASEASTSLSSILSTLLKPSAAARSMLSSVGLSMDELRKTAAQEPNGLIQVFRTLDQTLTDEQFSVVVPNVRALRGAMNMLAQDAPSVDQVFQDVADSAGATDYAFGVVAQTAQFQLDKAMADSQVALIELWDTMRGPVINVLQQVQGAIKGLADWFKSLDPNTKNLVVSIGALAVALGPLMVAGGLVAKVFGGMVSTVGSLVSGIIKLGGAALSAVTGVVKLGQSMAAMGVSGMVEALKSGISSMIEMGKSAVTATMSFMAMNPVLTAIIALVAVLTIAWIGASDAFNKAKSEGGLLADAMRDVAKGADELTDSTGKNITATDMLGQAWNRSGIFFASDLMGQVAGVNDEIIKNAALTGDATEANRLLANQGGFLNDVMAMLPGTFGDAARQVQEYDNALKNGTQDQYLAKQSVDHFQEVLPDLTKDLKTVGDQMQVLSEEDAQQFADRFGITTAQVYQAFGDMQYKMTADREKISAELEKLPDDFDMTGEAADVMAKNMGVSADDIMAVWQDMKDKQSESLAAMKAELLKLPDDFLMTQDAVANFATQFGVSAQEVEQAWTDMGKAVVNSAQDTGYALGDFSKKGEAAFTAFQDTTKYSLDDVQNRIGVLQDRLTQLNEVDLATLGPSAFQNWQAAKNATQQELDQLNSYVANGGTEMVDTAKKDTAAAADAYKVMASDISGALKGLQPDSDKAWKDFTKSMKKGSDDSQAEVKKLQDRLTYLKSVDLGKLGPDALAAWTDMYNSTQTKLDQTQAFIANKGDIIANILPDALDNSQTDAKAKWDKIFTDAQKATDDTAKTVSDNAKDIGDAIPNELKSKLPTLQSQLDATKSKVTTTATQTATTAGTQADATASALPDSVKGAITPLSNALTTTFNTIKDIFDALAKASGPWGSAIGGNFISNLAQSIRDGRTSVANAAAYATDPIHGHSPPKVGPLKDIGHWAVAIAQSWIDPFQKEMRQADLLPNIAMPGLTGPIPQLAGAVMAQRDQSNRGRGDAPMIGEQNIYGMQPGDVERETKTAIRRIAFEWDLESL